MKGHIVHPELQWYWRDLRSRAPERTADQRWWLRRTIRDGSPHSERILRIRESDAPLDKSVERVAILLLQGSGSTGDVIELEEK